MHVFQIDYNINGHPSFYQIHCTFLCLEISTRKGTSYLHLMESAKSLMGNSGDVYVLRKGALKNPNVVGIVHDIFQ